MNWHQAQLVKTPSLQEIADVNTQTKAWLLAQLNPVLV
jgi:hypothetical protein